jgi:hypothetical protein
MRRGCVPRIDDAAAGVHDGPVVAVRDLTCVVSMDRQAVENRLPTQPGMVATTKTHFAEGDACRVSR